MEEPSARLKAIAFLDGERDLTLKGFSRPVPVYNVVAPTEVASA